MFLGKHADVFYFFRTNFSYDFSFFLRHPDAVTRYLPHNSQTSREEANKASNEQ